MGDPRQYVFGEYRLDAEQRALFHHGELVPLAPKLMETLTFLVERHGRIVEKQELMESVWRGVVVEEVGLARNISLLRKILSASEDAQSCIQTIPKRGYRFVAPVGYPVFDESGARSSQAQLPETGRAGHAAEASQTAAASQSAATPAPADMRALDSVTPTATPGVMAPSSALATSGGLPGSAVTAVAQSDAQWHATTLDPRRATLPDSESPAAPRKNRSTQLSVALIALILSAAMTAMLWRNPARAPTSSTRAMLAVLPVRNLTGDANLEYMSDGMTEELIAQLGSTDPERIGVIARTSSMLYKNTFKTVVQIARELGVDYVLEGSLRASQRRTRFTAKLVRASDQTQLWAEDYDRESQDLLALEDEIGRTVAREIGARLAAQPRTRKPRSLTINSASYQEYLLGRYYWNKGDQASLNSSIEHYRRALTEDPQNAFAQAGLADSYSALSDWYLPPRAVNPEAKAAAMRALELDESLSAAHNALCIVLANYEWNWSAAETECRRAIELNPNSPDTHDSYGYLLAYVGRFAEALSEIRRAEELDPLSFRIYCDGALIAYLARDYTLAAEQGKRSIALAPDYFLAHTYLALAYVELGLNDEAIAEAQKGVRLTDSSVIEGFLGYVYAATGKAAQAREILDHLTRGRAQHYVCAYELGTTHLRLGETDEAFDWLETAYDDRSLCIPTMKYDPRLDPVHSDPRFASLIRRVGFPPGGAQTVMPKRQ
jgi:TolB-like protein/DNA-binding winged helix-turn-helix (wHTH) protein/Tfp pilus assembly protein PilF